MKHITIERHWHFFPEEKMDKFKTKHCSKVNWTYMAAFTTAEKPNIKYHWELNPVKFRPLEQHCEIHICGVHLHWWLRTRFVSGEEDVQTQAAQKTVQLVKGANLQVFPAAYAISVLTFYQDADKRIWKRFNDDPNCMKKFENKRITVPSSFFLIHFAEFPSLAQFSLPLR